MRSPSLVALVASCLLAVGCNDPLDPDSCQPDGFAEGDGLVLGAPLGPFARAAQVAVASPLGITHALAFDEVAGACGEVPLTGRRLVLLFCAPPVAREYRVVGQVAFACPGDDVLALVEHEGGVDVVAATSGTLTIDAAAGCVRGAYSVAFDSGELGGAFDAVACE